MQNDKLFIKQLNCESLIARYATTILALFLCFSGHSQNNKILFVHAEYQVLNYNYITIGLGFQPKRQIFYIDKRDACSKKKFKFNGITLSLNKKLENNDWGVATQLIGYCADFRNPIGAGIEFNYKSVIQTDHFSIKPLIGLSFPIISLMYGYNFDFYKTKAERINQHELIISLRIPILKRKK